MKKSLTTQLSRVLILLFTTLLLGNTSGLRAQCGGSVNLDQSYSPGGDVSSFSISTTFPNELILISTDGFSLFTTGTGPVTVDGNPATKVNSSYGGEYSGAAEVYAYPAAAAGTHNIVVNESGYEFAYKINAAASFYATGYNTVLNLSSITSSVANGSCSCYDASITTLYSNSMIYATTELNSGVHATNTITWTGANSLTYAHELDGIDCGDAYEPAATPGLYTITATNNVYDYGSEMVLVAIENTGLTPVVTELSPVSCNQGIAAVTFVSGTAPYTYSWSNGGSTDTISNLSVGTYTVTVTDNTGCSGTGSVVITNATPMGATLTTDFNPINCLSNGILGVTAFGGNPPYTYSWSNGETTANDTDLSVGSYTLTLTDNCLNTSSFDYTLTTVGLSLTGDLVQNASCSSSDNGIVAVTVNGGVSPYTYLWAPGGQTTDTVSNLSVGTYTVTVMDSNGCTGSITVDVSGPAPFTNAYFTDIHDPSNCMANGSLGIYDFIGGTPPYTFAWSNGATTDTITNLPNSSADYCVTVTDACGNSIFGCYFLFAEGLTFDVQVLTDANTCAGGEAYVYNLSATPPYTFSWSDGETTDTAYHLGGGYDYVTVTDSGGGCTATQYFYMPGSVEGTEFFIEQSEACYGDSNGSMTAYVYEGVSPYTYLWYPGGQTTATITGLSAGTYTVTVTDACDDSLTESETLFTLPELFLTPTVTQEATCSQLGCVTAIASGGAGYEYTFNWYDSTNTLIYSSFSFFGNSSSDCSLSAGNYTIILSDADGCTTTATFSITEPATLMANATVISNVSCYTQGSAQSSPTGGTSPYTYSWSNGATTSVITGLSAGTYTLTVTDSNACTATGSVTITQPANALNASVTVTSNANCFNANGGSAEVTATAGIPPYTYTWSNGATTSSVSGLSAGTYTVTVNDSAGCIVTDLATITMPAPLQICTLPVTVNFAYTGSLQTFTVPAGITQATITAIGGGGGGSTDENTLGGAGATMVGVVSLVPGNVLNIVAGGLGTENPGIDGGAGGGGSFVWDNTASNLLVVAGGGGGAAYISYNGYAASTTTTPTGIGGGSGELGGSATTFDAGGGGAGYLGNGATEGGGQAGSGGNDMANGFAGGAGDAFDDPTVAGGYGGGGGAGYDGGGGGGGYNGGGAGDGILPGGGGGSYVNGSVSSTATSNTGNGSVSIAYTIPGGSITVDQNASCFGGSNGILSVACVSGGTSPYTYSWAPGGASTATASNLSAGTYTLTITDSIGCTLTASATISQPANLLANATVLTNASLCFAVGSAQSSPTGGTPSYTYSWSNGATTAMVSGLSTGSYSVMVTDSNGCTATGSVTITQPGTPLIVNATVTANDNCNGSSTGSAQAAVTGGSTPYTYAWSNGASTSGISSLSAGTYTVTVTDSAGCTATGGVTITQPNPIIICASGPTVTQTFSYTGGLQSWTVPSGVLNATITAYGAEGGEGTFIPGSPGNGAEIEGAFSLTPGNTLDIMVGQQGLLNNEGSGGGGSFVWNTTGNILMVAAGGGGGVYESGNGGNGSATETPTAGTGALGSSPGGSGGNGGSGGACGYIYAGGGGGAGWFSDGGTGSSCGGYGGGGGGNTPLTGGAGGASNAANGCTYSSAGAYGGGGASTCYAAGGGGGYNGGGGAQGFAITGASGGGGGGSYDGGDSILALGGVQTGNGMITIAYPANSGIVVTNVTCFGDNNGSVGVPCVSGGATPYTYAWTPGGATTAMVSNLSAGTYSLTITDSNGCSITSSATITQPAAPLSANATVISNVISCNLLGSAQSAPSGGTPSYTYSWSNGATTSTITGLSAATYTVTVTDSNACTATGSVTITAPANVLAANVSVTSDATCSNSNGGSAQAAATGGTTPYTYTWSTGATTSSISGLSAGTYTITVNDNAGCSSTGSATITQPAPIIICASGPPVTQTFSYTGSLQSFTVPAGVISATVTAIGGGGGGSTGENTLGGAGATMVGVVSLVPGNVLNIVAGGQGTENPSDDGGAGGGGSFVWDNTASNLLVVAGGGGGAEWITSNGYAASTTTTPNGPGGGTGELGGSATTFDAGGGGAGYLGNGGTYGGTEAGTGGNDMANGFGGGAGDSQYDLSVVGGYGGGGGAGYDGGGGGGGYNGGGAGSGNFPGGGGSSYVNGTILSTATTNTGNGSVTISYPTNVGLTVTNVTCFNGANGSISIPCISGGTTPYTYLWAPGGATTASVSNLSAGTYTVTVSGVNSCSATATATITQPSMIDDSTVAASVVNVSCNGGSNGSATVGVIGGTAPYTYLWSDANSQTNATATGLSAGTYSVNVTDNNGCSGTTDVVTITQPNVIDDSIVTASVMNATCNGNSNGSATVGVIGGTSPYTYTWTPNVSSTAIASGLSVGTYSVMVTDNNGCSGTTAVVTITQPTLLNDSIVSAATINVVCKYDSTGSITVGATGGTSPYTYNWSPNVSSAATASGLSAGTYSVSVTDSNGCSGPLVSVTITQPSEKLRDSATIIVNIGCYLGDGGQIAIGTRGGVSPYTYTWSPNVGSTYWVTGLTAGSYTVTITDNIGCSHMLSFTLTQPSASLFDSVVTESSPLCYGGFGSATVGSTGGTMPYTYLWNPSGDTTASASNLVAGIYTVRVRDVHGCSASCTVTITQTPQIQDSVSSEMDVLCNGGSTGSATIGVSGGASPYTYTWSPNVSSTATASGLSAGSYSITITDANGCSSSTAVAIIGQPMALTDNVVILSNPGCNGGNGGSATANVTGGISPYTYLWSPVGKTTYTVTGLTAGTYTVSVTDNNGCNNTASVTITQPVTLKDTVTSILNEVCVGLNSTATVGSSGGVSPYTYYWSPNGNTNATCSTLSVGAYTVTVTDANGCNASCTVDISQPAPIIDSIVAALTVNVSCNGLSDGSATVGVLGGNSPYTYTWTPNVSSTATATGLSAGTYSVIVSDSSGCSGAIISVTITQPFPLRDSAAVVMNVGCFGGNGGEISIGTRGGNSPYTYLWTPNVSSIYKASGLSAGTYSITITDNKGCSNSLAVTITQPAAALVATVTGSTNPICYGGTGTASVGVTGGTPPYTYQWTSAYSTTSSATGLPAGTYTVKVNDMHGCDATTSVTITQPAEMIINMVHQNVTSNAGGNCNGMAGITSIVGGTPPYTYLWTPGGQTTDSITHQCAGDYCVTVTDANGCSENACVVIATTVGIQPIAGNSSVSIYPDPNNGMFTVEGVYQGQLIEVYNAIGQQLCNVIADNSTMHFNISDKANGIYLVRILNKDGTLVTQIKMVKTR